MIKYEPAPDVGDRVARIVGRLGMDHVDLQRVICLRSRGSRSRYIMARCHALPQVFQKALGTRAHYVIEVVSEKFDSLSTEDQTRILIHEILHIPKSFGGGFKHHNYVNRRRVEAVYEKYKSGD